MDTEKLNEEIDILLRGLPQELSAAVREKVTFYKTKIPVFKPAEILDEAKNLLRLEMLAYLDRRQYLGMYNRRFAEHKIDDYVREVVGREKHEERDLYTLGRINFDLNGLKALNDLGGHDAGNKGLKLLANILNFGRTTLWLRDELKLTVIPSAEGGDEFGILLFGRIDLRSHIDDICKKYFFEVYEADVSHLINFGSKEVRDNLQMLGIAEDVSSGFVFRISTSVGACLLGEALAEVDVSRMGISFEEMVSDISNEMFKIADKRSAVQKSKFKQELAKSDPVLSGLYARMSKEVIHLEHELRAAKHRIYELESKK
ncbi:MAG TPA: GGDEF domain-containing protein [Candidatus Paceibacterota bacterium]